MASERLLLKKKKGPIISAFTKNGLPVEIKSILVPDGIKKALPTKQEELIKQIIDYKKQINEEWTASIPMHAAIELDNSGFVFTPAIKTHLDEYAKELEHNNFTELVSSFIG